VLPLGMWPECFAHTRGGAGAVLGGRRAASGEPALRVPAPPPRWQALPATRCLGGQATGVGGGGRRDARRAPRPPPGLARPPPGPARRGMAGGAARPPLPSPLAGAVPLCPRARRSPLPRRAGGQGAGAGAGGGAAAERLRGPASAPRLAVARASR
jgi:hypothetical protein